MEPTKNSLTQEQTAMVNKIRKTIDSANINFLVGAGLSDPFLEILGGIELSLTKAKDNEVEVLELKKEYFEKSILGNLKIVNESIDSKKDEVLKNYEEFYKRINNIILKRENSILTKQINIFTTNVDIFSEKALENTGIDFNDGFHGRFNPKYDVGNFKKSYFKKSLHYENTSEIPVFNILKLHGSLSWKEQNSEIYLDNSLKQVKEVDDNKGSDQFDTFYSKLMMVNPTKKKLEDTLLNRRYYDLLRFFSNELEKENTVLFVMGFSFADEHIFDLTLRVANSNPTLSIYIFNHGLSPSDIYLKIKKEAKNIEIILPEKSNKYNLETITSNIFDKITPLNEAVDIKEEEESKTTKKDGQ